MEIHKTIFLVLGLVLVFALGYVSGGLLMGRQPGHDSDSLYQVSTYSALAGGAYAPVEPVRALMENGDLGLGTFAGLDGEMVVVDGTCYQVKSDGIARPADPSLGVPFAAVTFFSPDITVPGIVAENLTQLDNAISARLPDPNLFYAIRIDGTFPDIRVRSVPAQSRPYPPLADALTHQVVYEYHNVTGTVVGFYTPASAAGLNVVGYHFHFITTDRNRGGHVLDIAAAGDTAELDPVARYTVVYTAGDNGS